eukprot:maker-scaffold_34-snap-gene-2.41-mRNA-1 protein AED:0.00 eAED:0.00 QI:66/1/1/1/0/0/2/120/234
MKTESQASINEPTSKTEKLASEGDSVSVASIEEVKEVTFEEVSSKKAGREAPEKKTSKVEEERPEDYLVTESEGESDEEDDDSDNEELAQNKRSKFMPPPPKVIERPPAIFDHNILGLVGMFIAGVQIYALTTAGEEFRYNGLGQILSVSSVTYLLAGAWTFLSNLEGYTRFPYITILFVAFGFAAPALSWQQASLMYKTFLYGPLIYIIFCTFCALVNAENEKEHGFKGTFYS